MKSVKQFIQAIISLIALTTLSLSVSAMQVNPELLKAMKMTYAEEHPELDFESSAMLEAYYTSGLVIAQSQYRHHKAGLDSDWPTYQRMVASYFATQWVHSWWKEQSASVFDDDFIAEINRVVEETDYAGDYWTKFIHDKQ